MSGEKVSIFLTLTRQMLAAVYGIAVPDSPRCWLELFPLGFCHVNLALRLSLFRLSQSFLSTELNTGPSGSSSTCVDTRWCMREMPGTRNLSMKPQKRCSGPPASKSRFANTNADLGDSPEMQRFPLLQRNTGLRERPQHEDEVFGLGICFRAHLPALRPRRPL